MRKKDKCIEPAEHLRNYDDYIAHWSEIKKNAAAWNIIDSGLNDRASFIYSLFQLKHHFTLCPPMVGYKGGERREKLNAALKGYSAADRVRFLQDFATDEYFRRVFSDEAEATPETSRIISEYYEKNPNEPYNMQ